MIRSLLFFGFICNFWQFNVVQFDAFHLIIIFPFLFFLGEGGELLFPFCLQMLISIFKLPENDCVCLFLLLSFHHHFLLLLLLLNSFVLVLLISFLLLWQRLEIDRRRRSGVNESAQIIPEFVFRLL